MSEQKRDGPEPYSKKLIKYAWQGTWHFSKQQIIFSSILGIIAAPIAYALGLAPSVGLGILAVFIVSAIAFFLAGFYNFLRTPALIHREQQQEIEALRGRPAALVPAELVPARAAPVALEPNLVCMSVGFDQVEIEGEHDIVQDGLEHVAVIAEFVNTPHPDRRIGSVHHVFAVIRYFDANNRQVCNVNHGSWMDEEWRTVDFAIGDRRRLVLAVQLVGGNDYRPEMDALRAIQNNHEDWQRYRAPEYWYL
jgi:hypothetical protein